MKKLIVLCLIAMFAAQACMEGSDVKGVYTEQMSFESFDGIKVSRFLNVKVVKGDRYEVKVNIPERYKDSLLVEVNADNNLIVKLQRNEKRAKRREKFEIEVICPSFNRIVADAMSEVNVMSGFSFENVELNAYALSTIFVKEQMNVKHNCKINASDLSKIELSLEVENMVVKSSDMSTVTIIGTASTLDAKASDLSRIRCQKLIAKTVKATAHAMSEVFVNADEKLNMDASDMSRIRYSGSGEVAKKRTESLSSISKR